MLYDQVRRKKSICLLWYIDIFDTVCDHKGERMASQEDTSYLPVFFNFMHSPCDCSALLCLLFALLLMTGLRAGKDHAWLDNLKYHGGGVKTDTLCTITLKVES